MPQNSDPYYDERIIDVKNRHTSRLLALNNVHTVAKWQLYVLLSI